MKTGFEARLGRNITVAEYHHHYGAKLIEGKPNPRPPVICPACRGALHTVGEADLVDATWAHNPTKAFCPIKDSGKSKYELLTPKAPVPAAAIALRNSFFINWKQHWSFARSLADFAGIEDLIGFIRHADRIGLWGHATLSEWHLPYVFLATCEFKPPKGKARSRRPEWLRFRFDSRLRTIEDLWIRILPNVKFLKLKYRAPRSGVPTAGHYIDCDLFDLDRAWMTTHVPDPPHAYALKEMHAAFAVELGPLPVKT
ncbi:MAG: hypothetical protein K2W93_02475 [Burkholderiaceae bacterium]|nr:hypothetical protein [Burkholderiaceae bacterium]